MDRHTLYGVEWDSKLVGGIEDYGVQANSELGGESASGSIAPAISYISAQNPTASFRTTAIATAFATLISEALGVYGVAAKDGDALAFYLQKCEPGAGRASGSVHRKLTITNGCVYARSLTVDHQRDARIEYGVTAFWDGTNVPVIAAESQSLPVGTLSDAERFTLGPITIGGVTLNGFRSVRIDFGVAVKAEGAESEIWPRHASVDDLATRITIGGIDTAWFKASGGIYLPGVAAEHADTAIYLRKRAAGGTFVGDDESEHIGISLAGTVAPNDILTFEDKTGGTSIVIRAHHDGINMPLVVNPTVAIGGPIIPG